MEGDVTFEVWYQREHPRLVSALAVVSGDVGLAVEATDEACARTLEQWHRVGKMASPGGWAYRTALNVLRRIVRRRTLEARLLRRAPVRDGAPPQDWSLEIWEAMRSLPARERTAVALHHVADLPTAAVAEAMGVAPGTVAATLHAARTKLRHALAEQISCPEEARHDRS